MTKDFDRARRVADSVLLEGYVLYPYRANSTKNRYRWTFGVLAPKSWSEAGGCEPFSLRAEILVRGAAPRVRGKLRFLRVVDRRVQAFEGGSYRRVERLDVDGQTYVSWEEGELVEVDFSISIGEGSRTFPIVAPALEEIEPLRDAAGDHAGLVVRGRAPLAGVIEATIERVDHSGPALSKLTVRVENTSPFARAHAPRAEAVRAAFASTHLLLATADGASFVSAQDPPEDAVAAAARCTSVGTYPVLAGERGEADLMLASPIILYDHPEIAPQSPGDFFDATEIDELLALRTRTLSPEERALARATDARAAEIVERAEGLTPGDMAGLHGSAVGPSGPRPVLSEPRSALRPGGRVRLRPNAARRRTDAQDLLFAGRSATIHAVRLDVDGRSYLAVTLDDDPAAEMHRAKGRFHYYYPDEVEPLAGEKP